MERFPVHTIGSAPEASKSALGGVQARFGIIPNLAGAMATSPVLIQSFVGIFDKVHGGNFTEPQIQTVLLTDAVTNGSTCRRAPYRARLAGWYRSGGCRGDARWPLAVEQQAWRTLHFGADAHRKARAAQ
jgi:hypothetical protein